MTIQPLLTGWAAVLCAVVPISETCFSPSVVFSRVLRICCSAPSTTAWGLLCSAAYLLWYTALTPGLFISDSFSIFGHVDAGGFDTTFSYLYQLALKPLFWLGLSVRNVARSAFAIQLGLFYVLLFVIGRYLLSRLPQWIAWPFCLVAALNPVFPLEYALHSVNTPANLLFVLYLFLVYRVLRRELSRLPYLCVVAILGVVLTALRLDLAPSVALGTAGVLAAAASAPWRPRAFGVVCGSALAAVVVLHVALPRLLDFRPKPGAYIQSLIYRPLDKIFASDPKLLDDPTVTAPIEAVIRKPAASIVGHGEEVYWWDIDRNPPREVADQQLAVFFRLAVERFDVFLADRATVLVELLGSKRTFFIGDHLFFEDTSRFEELVAKWGLRGIQSRFRDPAREAVATILPVWTPRSPTYFLWNTLPYFLLLCAVALLYPLVPASAFVCVLVILRTLVLALAAPFGFYFYSTSLYVVGLFLALPFAAIEWRSRRTHARRIDAGPLSSAVAVGPVETSVHSAEVTVGAG